MSDEKKQANSLVKSLSEPALIVFQVVTDAIMTADPSGKYLDRESIREGLEAAIRTIELVEQADAKLKAN